MGEWGVATLRHKLARCQPNKCAKLSPPARAVLLLLHAGNAVLEVQLFK